MWEYLAGLFDGEGCFSIAKIRNDKGSINIIFNATFTGEREHLEMIRQLLLTENVHCYMTSTKNPIGLQTRPAFKLQIQNRDAIKTFLQKTKQFILLKKPHYKIMLEAITFKESLPKLSSATIANLSTFDSYRQRLHQYRKKGPKNLKPW